MKKIYQIFLQGLMVVLPLVITAYLLYWMVGSSEMAFSKIAKAILGKDLYVPGLGIVFTFGLIFCVGLLVNTYIVGRLIRFILRWFERLPIIKSIYKPLKDIIGMFDNSKHLHKRVVLIEEGDCQRIGLVTRDQFNDLPKDLQLKGLVAVYIPMSYMFGGITKLLPKEKLREVDIPVDQAIKLAITGWVKAEER